MLFNSIDFAIFLPIFFLLYWFLTNKNLKVQNFLILIASYLFYGWWDWRFLSLIFFSTIIDYTIGRLLYSETNPFKRKILLWTSISINLGVLGFFKYYNFFVENFVSAFTFLGMKISMSSLYIVLPIGISFYTFQTLSYTIDVYRKKLVPTKDFIAFSSFVSFFPQLVAGPIERATNLLPQFYKKRVFDYSKAVDGLRQVLWGFFKKIVIADSCAYYADKVFNHPDDYSGSSLAIAAIFFLIQVYCDFSGYSDIAIGTSRLFGFKLKRNFNFPFFSRNFQELWERWHISLVSWFRDYVYIPLGGGRKGTFVKIKNIFIVFFLTGLWHGARWNFIVWGILNAIYIMPVILTKKEKLKPIAQGRNLPNTKEILSIILTFNLFALTSIFMRTTNISDAIYFISKIFSASLFSIPEVRPLYFIVLLIVFFCAEWVTRESKFVLDQLGLKWKRSFRLKLYLTLAIAILWCGFKEQEFFYFQF